MIRSYIVIRIDHDEKLTQTNKNRLYFNIQLKDYTSQWIIPIWRIYHFSETKQNFSSIDYSTLDLCEISYRKFLFLLIPKKNIKCSVLQKHKECHVNILFRIMFDDLSIDIYYWFKLECFFLFFIQRPYFVNDKPYFYQS